MLFVSFPALSKAENQTQPRQSLRTQDSQKIMVSEVKTEQSAVVKDIALTCEEDVVKNNSLDNLIQQTELINLHSGLSCQQTIAIRNIEVQKDLAVINASQQQTIKVIIPPVELNQFTIKNNQSKPVSFIVGNFFAGLETSYEISQKTIKVEKTLQTDQNLVTQVELKYLQVMRC